MRHLVVCCVISGYAGFMVGILVMSQLTASRRERRTPPPATQLLEGPACISQARRHRNSTMN
jgi:hypothetical protein